MVAPNASLDSSQARWQGALSDLPFDFRQLRIAVVHPPDRDGEFLLRQLQRLRCQVNTLWPPPNRIEVSVDIVFCLLRVETYALCNELLQLRETALAAIFDPADPDPRALQILAAVGPQVVLTKPCDAVAILTNVIVAYTNSRYQKRLLNKIAKLEETLRSIRTVERAKLILMKARNIDEPEAYAYLRDQAMRKRISVASVASVVIESGNILLGSSD